MNSTLKVIEHIFAYIGIGCVAIVIYGILGLLKDYIIDSFKKLKSKCIEKRTNKMNECNAKDRYQNMLVKDLKKILKKLPDNMPIIIPVIDEDDANHIYGFRYVRTAGELICEGEREPEVLCLNAAAYEQDIADQIHFSGRNVGVKNILFGISKYDKKENKK